MVKVLCAINTKAEKLWIYTDCEQRQSDKKVYINLDSPFRLLEPMCPIFRDPSKTYLAAAEVSVAVDKYRLTLSIVIIFPFQNNMDSTQSLFLWFCPVLDIAWNQTESSNLDAGYYPCRMRMPYKRVCMWQTLLHGSQLNILSSSSAGGILCSLGGSWILMVKMQVGTEVSWGQCSHKIQDVSQEVQLSLGRLQKLGMPVWRGTRKFTGFWRGAAARKVGSIDWPLVNQNMSRTTGFELCDMNVTVKDCMEGTLN